MSLATAATPCNNGDGGLRPHAPSHQAAVVSHARITIVRQWPDGDAIKVTVSIDANYPDALDQARGEARRAFADACDVVLTDEQEPDALPDLPAEVVLPERLDRTRDEDE